MNILAKHEIDHIRFCCDDEADICGRNIAGLYVECDFDKGEAVATQKKFGGGNKDILCRPTDTVWQNDGNAKRNWLFS